MIFKILLTFFGFYLIYKLSFEKRYKLVDFSTKYIIYQDKYHPSLLKITYKVQINAEIAYQTIRCMNSSERAKFFSKFRFKSNLNQIGSNLEDSEK